jgi:hypothetical protein
VTSVLFVLFPPARQYRTKADEEFISQRQPTAEHVIRAQAAIEWAKEIPEEQRVDYLGNVNVLARAGYVIRKSAGLAASILAAHSKRAKIANRPAGTHVGTVGKRLDLTLTCERLISSAGQFGNTGIHRLTDASGNELTWFASESTSWIPEGQTRKVRATVKKHETYRDRPQTVLTRVTVIDEARRV